MLTLQAWVATPRFCSAGRWPGVLCLPSEQHIQFSIASLFVFIRVSLCSPNWFLNLASAFWVWIISTMPGVEGCRGNHLLSLSLGEPREQKKENRMNGLHPPWAHGLGKDRSICPDLYSPFPLPSPCPSCLCFSSLHRGRIMKRTVRRDCIIPYPEIAEHIFV